MGVIKAGDNFVTYLLDKSVDSGDWNTGALRVGNIPQNGGAQPDVSHVTLYGILGNGGPGPDPDPDPDPDPVPLPAAGWMLLAALGGLAFWRRRQSA